MKNAIRKITHFALSLVLLTIVAQGINCTAVIRSQKNATEIVEPQSDDEPDYIFFI
ncbi:MAG: hypothetical protein IJP92_10540 [Lachnospiraceae bacterium]|nr:hypothetical protein [Lachnospiraceae bacterium]